MGPGWARAAAGVAYVWRTERGEVEECFFISCRYRMLASSTVGLAGQVDLVWAPWGGFGLGLTALGNLNSRRSFAALTASVHLGRVR